MEYFVVNSRISAIKKHFLYKKKSQAYTAPPVCNHPKYHITIGNVREGNM